MRWLTMKEAAARTGLTGQSVRRMFPVRHFGRAVRVWEGDLMKVGTARVLAVLDGDPGLAAVVRDYRNAEAVIEHLSPDADAVADPEMAALLTGPLAACRLDHPDWPAIGVSAVFPPVLAFLKQNLPQGGGVKGETVRSLISAA